MIITYIFGWFLGEKCFILIRYGQKRRRRKKKKKTFSFFWWISTVFIPFNNFYFLHLIYRLSSFFSSFCFYKQSKSASIFDVYRFWSHIYRRHMTSFTHTELLFINKIKNELIGWLVQFNMIYLFDFRKYCLSFI